MADDRGDDGGRGDDGVLGLLDELAGELRDEMRAGLDELRAAFAELRDDDGGGGGGSRTATPPSSDGGIDLDAMAQSLGVSRKQLEASIGAARSAERRDELRPILASLLEEMGFKPKADDDDDDGQGGDGGGDPPKAKPKPRRRPAPVAAAGEGDPPAVTDSGPSKPHWSENAIGSLVR